MELSSSVLPDFPKLYTSNMLKDSCLRTEAKTLFCAWHTNADLLLPVSSEQAAMR